MNTREYPGAFTETVDAPPSKQNGRGTAAGKQRFTLIPFNDITVGSDRAYLVKGIIPYGGLVVVWGPPKCGKSFWTFDLMMHVALGRDYRGHRVQQGPVIYLALEGGRGFQARIEAFRQQFLPEHQHLVPLSLITDAVNLVRD